MGVAAMKASRMVVNFKQAMNITYHRWPSLELLYVIDFVGGAGRDRTDA